MKLATLQTDGRDGQLIIVSRDNQRFVSTSTAPTLQYALDHWSQVEHHLQTLYHKLNSDQNFGEIVDVSALHSPLPRAYEWIDGSAYINHIVLVRQARNAEPPATLRTDPLVYQGGSSNFLPPTADIPLANEDWGLDFEAEVCVVLDDIPQGTKGADIDKYIRLIMLCNDITLRNLIPPELHKGFGFFVSKPATAFSPFAVTPDELGEYWQNGRLFQRMRTTYNDALFGNVDTGPEMYFSFRDIIEHICQTRSFCAGTIVGSGTISNKDSRRGSSCLSEKRMLEKINEGVVKTPYMKGGDRIQIEVLDQNGLSIFGQIDQVVSQQLAAK